MADYFLIDQGAQMPRWCELVRREEGGLGWMDTRGLVVPQEAGWALAHVEGDGPDSILAANETIAGIERGFACLHLLDPWSDQGWLSPKGLFYGCGFARHELLAHALIRRRVGALEAEGWVRVNPDSFRMSEYGGSGRGPNRRQQEVLFELGFHDPRPGIRRVGRPEPDRRAPPPSFAFVPPAGTVLPAERRERPPAGAPRPEPVDAARAVRLRLLDRLRQVEGLGEGLAGDPAHDRDFGGRWTWMLRFDGFDLGAEESPSALLRAAGLRLDATAFDQVELVPWPLPGVEITPAARALLAPAPAPGPGR